MRIAEGSNDLVEMKPNIDVLKQGQTFVVLMPTPSPYVSLESAPQFSAQGRKATAYLSHRGFDVLANTLPDLHPTILILNVNIAGLNLYTLRVGNRAGR